MWDHAANCSPEHLGRGSEVEGTYHFLSISCTPFSSYPDILERTTTGGVETGLLAEEGLVLELGAEELAGDVEGFTSDDDNLLAVEKLLGDNAGQATEEVSLAVNDDLYRFHISYSVRHVEDCAGGVGCSCDRC